MGQWHVLLNERILQRFWIEEGGTVKIGRGKTADVDLDNTAVSRRHAAIGMRDGRYFVKDLESTNGTRVNGEKITGTVPLTPSDHVEIAKFLVVPATSAGNTYPPYAMVREADFDPASSPEMPADFEGTIFVAPRQLVVVQGEASPERFSLKDQTKVTIGKDETCHIRVYGHRIGKIQCYVITKGTKHYAAHQSGWKRTTINGKKIVEAQLLRKGDIIGIGKSKIQYT